MSGTPFDPHAIETVLCDLDGVVWLAHVPIAGSVAAIAALRVAGRRVVFVTNNSAATIDDHVAALGSIGVPAAGDVISSAQAAATLVERGERVLVAGGPGVVEAVERRGAHAIVNDGSFGPGDDIAASFDAVIVGLHRDVDYPRLAAATAAVHGGARLIGTNTDSTYPTPRGLAPGGGAILAAVATAAGREPVIGGKPHAPMAALIRDVVGLTAGEATSVLMVGDRPETDGLLADRIGCPFALVRSGVESGTPGRIRPEPALDVADLAAVEAVLRR